MLAKIVRTTVVSPTRRRSRCDDRHKPKLGKRRVTVDRIDTLAPDGGLKRVGDFEPPQAWDQGAGVRHTIEQDVGRRGALIIEIPGIGVPLPLSQSAGISDRSAAEALPRARPIDRRPAFECSLAPCTAPSAVNVSAAAIRFLYKVTLQRGCDVDDVVPTGSRMVEATP